MGFFDKSRREQIRANQSQGREGEEKVKRFYEFIGYNVERTGRGHDFKVTIRNWLTGKKETKYVEVKTGNSKFSKLQKIMKRRFGDRFIEERLETNPFGLFVKINVSKGFTSNNNQNVRKNSSIYDSLLDSGKSSRKKKKKSSSRYHDLLGTGGSSRKNSSSRYKGLI